MENGDFFKLETPFSGVRGNGGFFDSETFLSRFGGF